MEKEYVYIARIITHLGEFLPYYYKIGKTTKQYKIRETQLSPTHLPFDVLMVRVFEVKDCHKTEIIFQTCFEDYTVTKEYVDRKSITTEWLYMVTDEEKLYNRLDKIVKYSDDITEIDLLKDIDRKSTRLNSSHTDISRMPSSA